jgi:hypothetical protein
MNAALSEIDKNARRYATDKSDKNWYWGVGWVELCHVDKATGRAFKQVV